jgi:hypothetical protein
LSLFIQKLEKFLYIERYGTGTGTCGTMLSLGRRLRLAEVFTRSLLYSTAAGPKVGSFYSRQFLNSRWTQGRVLVQPP